MTLFQAFGQFAGQAAAPAISPGMVLLTPTSATVTGGGTESVTINPNGSLTVSNAYSVSVNGVFSATYKNYFMMLDSFIPTGASNSDVEIRWRASGVDASGSNTYTFQRLLLNSTTVSSGRTTNSFAALTRANTPGWNVTAAYIFNPFLAAETVYRSVSTEYNTGGMRMNNHAGTHNQTTSYDGFTLRFELGGSTPLDLRIAVYGLKG